MDAIQQFAECGYCESWVDWQMKSTGQPSPVTQFVVGGASKRGWTTWTTGVGDARVAAIVPVVMDLLNLLPNAAHFWAALGGWTFEFEDYVTAGFTSQLGNPNTQRMADIVDPYSYFRDQPPWAPSAQSKNFAQMPKLVGAFEPFCPGATAALISTVLFRQWLQSTLATMSSVRFSVCSTPLHTLLLLPVLVVVLPFCTF